MDQIFIKGIALPGHVRGVTVMAPNDDFMVFINTNLCPETQQRAIAHEVRHIRQDHFYNEDPVIVNELEADII